MFLIRHLRSFEYLGAKLGGDWASGRAWAATWVPAAEGWGGDAIRRREGSGVAGVDGEGGGGMEWAVVAAAAQTLAPVSARHVARGGGKEQKKTLQGCGEERKQE